MVVVVDASTSELTVGQAIESTWCSWIGALPPWERRFVLANELEYHDLFASGEWGWADLVEAIREHFAPRP